MVAGSSPVALAEASDSPAKTWNDEHLLFFAVRIQQRCPIGLSYRPEQRTGLSTWTRVSNLVPEISSSAPGSSPPHPKAAEKPRPTTCPLVGRHIGLGSPPTIWDAEVLGSIPKGPAACGTKVLCMPALSSPEACRSLYTPRLAHTAAAYYRSRKVEWIIPVKAALVPADLRAAAFRNRTKGTSMQPRFLATIVVMAVFVIAVPSFMYEECRIDVPNRHMAVLTHKVGKDLPNGTVLAPTHEYKGVQKDVLTEGRYYYNPYEWTWEVVPQVEIPEGKLGVRIRMYGDDLAGGRIDRLEGERKRASCRRCCAPGRYPINACMVGATRRSTRQLRRDHRAARSGDVPAGFKGLITDLTRPRPSSPTNFFRPRANAACKPTPWSRARII